MKEEGEGRSTDVKEGGVASSFGGSCCGSIHASSWAPISFGCLVISDEGRDEKGSHENEEEEKG